MHSKNLGKRASKAHALSGVNVSLLVRIIQKYPVKHQNPLLMAEFWDYNRTKIRQERRSILKNEKPRRIGGVFQEVKNYLLIL